MPLKDGMVLVCRADQVELSSEVFDPSKEDPSGFGEAVRARLLEDQYRVMTDPAILNPPSLAVASALICREAIPPAHEEILIRLGFRRAAEGPAGSFEEHSLFGWMGKKGRSKLDRFLSPYLRAGDLSPEWGELETGLAEALSDLPLPAMHQEATEALISGAQDHLQLVLRPGTAGLEALERQLLHAWAAKKGRLVLHPALVRAIAAFAGDSIVTLASETEWSDDPQAEAPLLIAAPGGAVVASDPELRVVQLVTQGRNALLSAYANAVVRQSLTAGDNRSSHRS